MGLIKTTLATAAIAGGLIAGAVGLGATASADQPPPAPNVPASDPPPDWAPAKPPQPVWAPNNPVVWSQGWGRWGIWVDNGFLTLS